MADSRVGLSIDRSEPGATPEALKATETVVGLLYGFSNKLAQSILMNAVAMVLAHVSDSETAAVESTKQFRKEVERCIRVNYQTFKTHEREGRR